VWSRRGGRGAGGGGGCGWRGGGRWRGEWVGEGGQGGVGRGGGGVPGGGGRQRGAEPVGRGSTQRTGWGWTQGEWSLCAGAISARGEEEPR